jgi:hypothetical protein
MGLGRWSVSLAAVIGLLAATVAAAVIWLLITDPVQTADAASRIATGDVNPMVRAIGSVIVDALRGLFKYL